MAENKEIHKKHAPTLWLIIGIKLVKGLIFAGLAQRYIVRGLTFGAVK